MRTSGSQGSPPPGAASPVPPPCGGRSSGWMSPRSKRASRRTPSRPSPQRAHRKVAAQGGSATGLRALAVDGKAVRGAAQRHGAKVHLVSIVSHAQTQVLGQVAVAAKSHEIPAVQDLLRDRDLRGCLVTLDALHTQHTTTHLILAHGGHYLLVVKANQPDLYTALTAWFAEAAWADEQEAQVTTGDVGHGRHEHRTLTRRLVETRLLGLMGWPGLHQALRRVTWAQLRSRGEERGAVTYALTSLPATVLPSALEAAWRGHWTIENQLHSVRDVTPAAKMPGRRIAAPRPRRWRPCARGCSPCSAAVATPRSPAPYAIGVPLSRAPSASSAAHAAARDRKLCNRPVNQATGWPR